MRLYPNSLLQDTRMAASRKGKTCHEIDAIDNDIEFMKSMIQIEKLPTHKSTK